MRTMDLVNVEQRILEPDLCTAFWSKYLPGMVSVFAWRMFLDRLASKWNLVRREEFKLMIVTTVAKTAGIKQKMEIIYSLKCCLSCQIWMRCQNFGGYFLCAISDAMTDAYIWTTCV